MRYCLCIVISLLSTGVHAQWDNVVFLDSLRRVVNDESEATYFRATTRKPDIIELREYFLSGKPALEAQCTSIAPTIKYHGKVVEYYKNGNLKSEEFYSNDVPTGISKSYYENGTLKVSMLQRPDKGNKYFKYNSSTGIDLMPNGSAVMHTSSAGGWDTYLVIKDSVAAEKYSINMATGDTTAIPDKVAEFRGGLKAMANFLEQNVRYPPDARRSGAQGTVYVSLIVTRTGSLSDIDVIKPLYPSLDEEALRCVKEMPSWVPARGIKGNPVASRYVLPIKFSLGK